MANHPSTKRFKYAEPIRSAMAKIEELYKPRCTLKLVRRFSDGRLLFTERNARFVSVNDYLFDPKQNSITKGNIINIQFKVIQ